MFIRKAGEAGHQKTSVTQVDATLEQNSRMNERGLSGLAEGREDGHLEVSERTALCAG